MNILCSFQIFPSPAFLPFPPPRPQAPPPAAASTPATAWHLADARRRGRQEATLGRRRGRGAGAQMGATEKGGKKSRRLFSSLRPWKATRRLWRTRSAPKAAQGECGRGRGTCYCARPAPGSDCGISGRVLRPRDPRAGVARPGGPAQRGRPCILTLGHGKKSSSRASLGSLLQTQGPVSAQSPLFPPPGPISVSRWRRWLLLYFPAKVPVCSFGSGQKESRVPQGHSLTQICIPLPNTWQAPAMQHPLGK